MRSVASSRSIHGSPEERLAAHLAFLYGEEQARALLRALQAKMDEFRRRNPQQCDFPTAESGVFDQKEAILIVYGDQISEPERPPLLTLAEFLESHLRDVISGVHLLPFFPYSSDDGFSVIDYRQVNPALGTWEHIARLGQGFRLMFDMVLNHVSRQSEWFKAFQRGEAPYRDYFIVVAPEVDLSQVVRPRALPLLSPVETAQGTRYVWTTFSEDQIDLNYANPQVLLELIDLMLFYVERGASILRLDAIAYLWKQIGTPCIHLPQTHRVVKILRAVLDAVAPKVVLLTETNVPHEENIQYFGEPLPEGRTDEAQMVYQFPLAPLVLHTFHSGEARTLMEWASAVEAPYPGTTFFNFIASHDGIGVRPAEGLLTPDQVQALIERILAHGGLVSYRAKADGSKSVYELNTTLYDALNNPRTPNPELDIRRFLASQAIMLSLAGVPGIYFQSLIGARNCHTCVERSGMARSINREKFHRQALEQALSNSSSRESRVFRGYLHMLHLRRQHSAFHPQGAQQMLFLNDQVFSVLRMAPRQEETMLCLTNVSSHPQKVRVNPKAWYPTSVPVWQDVLSNATFAMHGNQLELTLGGYQTLWLTSKSGGMR